MTSWFLDHNCWEINSILIKRYVTHRDVVNINKSFSLGAFQASIMDRKQLHGLLNHTESYRHYVVLTNTESQYQPVSKIQRNNDYGIHKNCYRKCLLMPKLLGQCPECQFVVTLTGINKSSLVIVFGSDPLYPDSICIVILPPLDFNFKWRWRRLKENVNWKRVFILNTMQIQKLV